jgi:hypothetical protein
MYTKTRLVMASLLMVAVVSIADAQVEKAAARANRAL